MLYREIPPHPLLKDYIKTYWYLNYDSELIQPFDIMPDGYFDLLIAFKNGYVDNTRITGVWSKMFTVNYSRCETIGIRFRPQALTTLLDGSIKEILDSSFQNYNLPNLRLDYSIFEGGQLDSDIDFNNLKKHLDKAFIRHLNVKKIDKRINSLFNLIEVTSGTISIETLSESIGFSTRQMNRRTKELIGIGPKDYAKIIRFKKALELIKYDSSSYNGYFDQSHFIKNFKTYTGLKPSEVDLRNNVRFLQYYDFDNE